MGYVSPTPLLSKVFLNFLCTEPNVTLLTGSLSGVEKITLCDGGEAEAVLTLGKRQEVRITCHRKGKDITLLALVNDSYHLTSGLCCGRYYTRRHII